MTNDMTCGALIYFMRLHILQMQKFGRISNQNNQNVCMREEMSTVDCIVGFNPYEKHKSQYLLRPVIVTTYNILPYLYMQDKFLLFSIFVHVLEHLKRSLDVFLQLLVYKFELLQKHVFLTYEVSCKETFQMQTVLM